MGEGEFWGEVRSWTHGEEKTFESLEVLLGAIEEDTQRERAAVYIAENLHIEPRDVAGVMRHFQLRYEERIAARIAQLEKHPLITNAAFFPTPPGARMQEVIDRIDRDWGIELPQSMLDFYLQLDGYELTWSSTSEDDYASYTSVALNSLDRVFGGYNGMREEEPWSEECFNEVFWMDWQDEEDEDYDLALSKSAKWLEGIEGVSQELGIVFDKETGESTLYLCDELDMYPLTLDFEGYIEMHIKLLGYPYWYFLFIDGAPDYMMNSVNIETIIGFFPDMEEVLRARLSAASAGA